MTCSTAEANRIGTMNGWYVALRIALAGVWLAASACHAGDTVHIDEAEYTAGALRLRWTASDDAFIAEGANSLHLGFRYFGNPIETNSTAIVVTNSAYYYRVRKLITATITNATLRADVARGIADSFGCSITTGLIYTVEIEGLTRLQLNRPTADDLTILDHTPQLTLLRIYDTSSETVDLSGLRQLRSLTVSGSMRRLILPRDSPLNDIYSWGRPHGLMEELDLSECRNLTSAEFHDLGLPRLRLPEQGHLSYFQARGLTLESLDLSTQSSLRDLRLSGNLQLRHLLLPQSGRLQTCSVYGSPLGSLTVQDQSNLELLYCLGTGLTHLEVHNSPRLQRLLCYGNALTALGLANCPALQVLDCGRNPLTNLFLNLPGLTNLSCRQTRLTNLDLRATPLLDWLDCASNALERVDLTPARSIDHADLRNNPLREILTFSMDTLPQQLWYGAGPTVFAISNGATLDAAVGGYIDPATGIGMISEGDGYSTSYQSAFLVATNAAQWAAMWARTDDGGNPPFVGFAQEIAVGFFAVYSHFGPTVSITHIEETASQRLVHVFIHGQPGMLPAFGFPYSIVRTYLSPKPLVPVYHFDP